MERDVVDGLIDWMTKCVMFSYEFVSMIIIPVSMIMWLELDSQQLTLQPSLLYWFALSCGGGNWTEFLLHIICHFTQQSLC